MARVVAGLDRVMGGHRHNPVCMLAENPCNNAYRPGTPCAPDRQHGSSMVQARPRRGVSGRALWRRPAVRLAAVANFPAGADDVGLALVETQASVAAGADEVDLVLPGRQLLSGRAADSAGAAVRVAAVRTAGAGRTLKLILESGELANPVLIYRASVIGLDAER